MPPGARVVGEPNDAAHGVMVVVAQRGAGTPVQDAIPEPPRVVGAGGAHALLDDIGNIEEVVGGARRLGDQALEGVACVDTGSSVADGRLPTASQVPLTWFPSGLDERWQANEPGSIDRRLAWLLTSSTFGSGGASQESMLPLYKRSRNLVTWVL
jgi:hypothetical protein